MRKDAGDCSPFSSVIKSARCSARTREKRPASEDSRIFCLSIAVGAVSELVFFLGRTAVAVAPRESGDVQGGVTSPVALDAAPLTAATLLRLDMALVVSSLGVAYFLCRPCACS